MKRYETAPSPAERRVQQLVGAGLPNKTIARELGIEETTVKAHLGALCRKLKVTNRVQIALDWHGVKWRRPAP